MVFNILIYLDDTIEITRKPLESITNKMNINKLRDNTLNNSDKATGFFDNYSHLINTPHPTRSHLINTSRSNTPCSTNIHPTNPNNTRLNNIHNTYSYSANKRTCFNDADDEIFHLNARNNRPTFGTPASFRSNDAESIFPAPFCNMENVYQICSWLCTNHNILLLAYNMYMSMQAPVENGFNFVSPTFNSPILATGTQHIQEDSKVRLSNNFIFYYLFLQLNDNKYILL